MTEPRHSDSCAPSVAELVELERFACSVAREAGDLLARRFRESTPVSVSTKGLHDYVSEADHESEALIVDRIRSRFPDHGVIAEEGSCDRGGSGKLCWIVDPLDATTNFIHGVPLFAVSIAVEGPGGIFAGAVYDPLRREMFHAALRQGARLNGQPIRCSRPESMGQALLATGFPFRELSRLEAYMESFAAFVRQASGIRRAGSAAIDLAYTACGRYDGFWEIGLRPWDVAAGSLLVREGGGVVTDIRGGGEFLSGDIIAAAPTVHAEMLRVALETLA